MQHNHPPQLPQTPPPILQFPRKKSTELCPSQTTLSHHSSDHREARKAQPPKLVFVRNFLDNSRQTRLRSRQYCCFDLPATQTQRLIVSATVLVVVAFCTSPADVFQAAVLLAENEEKANTVQQLQRTRGGATCMGLFSLSQKHKAK